MPPQVSKMDILLTAFAVEAQDRVSPRSRVVRTRPRHVEVFEKN